MQEAETGPHRWHGRLYAWSYSAFGQEPPAETDAWHYAVIVAGAFVFLACAFAIAVVLNIATLPLGVLAVPIWRTGPRFRRLGLPRGIPAIGVAVPVVLVFASWRHWQAHGLTLTVLPFLFVVCAGFLLLGCLVAFNKLRRGLRQNSLSRRAPRAWRIGLPRAQPAYFGQIGSNTIHWSRWSRTTLSSWRINSACSASRSLRSASLSAMVTCAKVPSTRPPPTRQPKPVTSGAPVLSASSASPRGICVGRAEEIRDHAFAFDRTVGRHQHDIAAAQRPEQREDGRKVR